MHRCDGQTRYRSFPDIRHKAGEFSSSLTFYWEYDNMMIDTIFEDSCFARYADATRPTAGLPVETNNSGRALTHAFGASFQHTASGKKYMLALCSLMALTSRSCNRSLAVRCRTVSICRCARSFAPAHPCSFPPMLFAKYTFDR